MPNGYTRTQIVLHWVIFVLIAAQFIFSEAMSEAWKAIERGTEIVVNPMVGQHVLTGLLILVLALWRVVIKLRRGAPPLPANEPPALKLVANLTHLVLYLLLLLVPVSGAVAWFARVEGAGEAHEILKAVLMLLILLHVLGALFQRFVLKSDVLTRIVRPNP